METHQPNGAPPKTNPGIMGALYRGEYEDGSALGTMQCIRENRGKRNSRQDVYCEGKGSHLGGILECSPDQFGVTVSDTPETQDTLEGVAESHGRYPITTPEFDFAKTEKRHPPRRTPTPFAIDCPRIPNGLRR